MRSGDEFPHSKVAARPYRHCTTDFHGLTRKTWKPQGGGLKAGSLQFEERVECRAAQTFLIQELYGSTGKANEGDKATIRERAEKIRETEKMLGYYVHESIADSAIFASTSASQVTVAKQFEEYGVYFDPCDKAPGTRHQMLTFLRERLTAAMERDGEPGLFIFDHCRNFIRTVPVLQRSQRDPDDVDTTQEDHIYDLTGYFLLREYSSRKIVVASAGNVG